MIDLDVASLENDGEGPMPNEVLGIVLVVPNALAHLESTCLGSTKVKVQGPVKRKPGPT